MYSLAASSRFSSSRLAGWGGEGAEWEVMMGDVVRERRRRWGEGGGDRSWRGGETDRTRIWRRARRTSGTAGRERMAAAGLHIGRSGRGGGAAADGGGDGRDGEAREVRDARGREAATKVHSQSSSWSTPTEPTDTATATPRCLRPSRHRRVFVSSSLATRLSLCRASTMALAPEVRRAPPALRRAVLTDVPAVAISTGFDGLCAHSGLL
jgi:hypothetical protein